MNPSRNLSLVVQALLALSFSCGIANSADWGNLEMRFVFDGAAPERPTLVLNKDIELCGKHMPKTEKLVVNPTDKGVANIVMWLDVKAGEKVAVHESYAKAATAAVQLANKGCRFDPHVCVLRTGQKLLIDNPDLVDHNTAAGLDRNAPFNVLTPSGTSAERSKFDLSEKVPAPIQCSIHPWMTGWLVVKDHPYVAVSDEHGRIAIKNLPTGELTFVVWHEIPTYVTEVTRGGQLESWKRGRWTLKLSAENSDFGEVKLSPDIFK